MIFTPDFRPGLSRSAAVRAGFSHANTYVSDFPILQPCGCLSWHQLPCDHGKTFLNYTLTFWAMDSGGSRFFSAALGIAANMEQLKFADVRFGGGGENIQADAGGCVSRKGVDAFMPDRVSFDDGFPLLAVPGFNAIALDVLAIVEPLHCERVIKRDRLFE